MNTKRPIILTVSWALASLATAGDTRLEIVPMTELSWLTAPGNIYQLQRADNPGAPWSDLGEAAAGDGSVLALVDPAPTGIHRVLQTVPGIPAAPAIPVNGGFETATGDGAAHWTISGNQPPTRSSQAAHGGSFSMRCHILNVGSSPGEGGLSQRIAPEGGTLVAGASYNFSFRAQQVSSGPSYIQQYQVQWLDSSGAVLSGGTGLTNFNGSPGTWLQINHNNLVAPSGTADARVFFRFVTGAVLGGHGEVFIDDVVLDSGTASPGTPKVVHALPVESRPVAALNWLSEPGKTYQPTVSEDMLLWDDLPPVIAGDGGIKSIIVPIDKPYGFFRLEIVGPGTPPDLGGGIIALFDSTTMLEAETTVHTPQALITYVGDRARDRHAREDMFRSYDHYLPFYWEQRTMAIEIIDRVAKGGNSITFNYTTLAPLSQPEFRAFFRGIGTVAEYHFNLLAPLVGPSQPNQYTATLTSKLPENRPLQIGDRVEIEISMFLQAPARGRSNYYGTTMLYIVGQGIVPWQAGKEIGLNGIVGNVNQSLDSYPLPTHAWLGGQTTLPYQYSDEPTHRFKQTAGNISPDNIQPFMMGRRLHHTDFGNGAHSEPGNPIFTAHAGKLGPQFIARSCVECHVNNGRALPPAIGAPMLQSVVKVGIDPFGTPHPTLGSVLQPQTTSGSPEGSAVISSYTYINGKYDDGTPYTLRKPNYTFQGVTPSHFSVRLTPPLVGVGLLEAVAEETILAMADPNDTSQDGISGRIRTLADPENDFQRLGRFTAKGGQAKVKHQIASALNTDMGIPSSIFPVLDGETTPRTPEISDDALDEMTRYLALLGVGARRSLNDTQALRGEQVFQTASCISCHTPTLTTGQHHPLAELRNQTIHPYTDLLLHDMGPGLADNMGEGNSSGSEWRTAPLWNIGFTADVSGGEAYLHDGRARTIEEAILWHGGEAEDAKNSFLSMDAADRAALVKFIKSL